VNVKSHQHHLIFVYIELSLKSHGIQMTITIISKNCSNGH
jgi:hypothetical protein